MDVLSGKAPLHGKRILITRATLQAKATVQETLRRGGIAVHFPCLELQCLADNIHQGLALLDEHNAEALFSSVNGVQCVAITLGKDFSSTFRRVKTAAVGQKTADALRQYHIQPDIVPEQHSQDGLIETYLERGIPERLVFFRAEEGREALAMVLEQQGSTVHTISSYRTICPQGDAPDVITDLKGGRIDAVMLGSSKTARHYVQRIGDIAIANNTAIAVISQQVAAVAKQLGLDVQIVAKEASFASMLDGLAAHFQSLTGA